MQLTNRKKIGNLLNAMQQRALLCISCLLACLVLLGACAAKQDWHGFQGQPAHGLSTYTAQMRTSDIRDGRELGTGKLFVAHNKLRYEMQGTKPLEQMVLLARLDSGRAWLVNPTGNACLEGSFAPQHWMDIEYLLEAFPGVVRSRIIVSTEEPLGKERHSGYKVSKIRRTGRKVLFGEEKDFTEFFWLAEESSIPLLHEDGMTRTELANIRKEELADSLFLPTGCRKVPSFADLLQ